MKSEPLGTARDADTRSLREAVPPSFVAPLSCVAEEIAARRNMPDSQKVRILLAIVRALSAPRRIIESVKDVDRLILTDPDEYERLLRSYWLLLGRRRVAA